MLNVDHVFFYTKNFILMRAFLKLSFKHEIKTTDAPSAIYCKEESCSFESCSRMKIITHTRKHFHGLWIVHFVWNCRPTRNTLVFLVRGVAEAPWTAISECKIGSAMPQRSTYGRLTNDKFWASINISPLFFLARCIDAKSRPFVLEKRPASQQTPIFSWIQPCPVSANTQNTTANRYPVIPEIPRTFVER